MILYVYLTCSVIGLIIFLTWFYKKINEVVVFEGNVIIRNMIIDVRNAEIMFRVMSTRNKKEVPNDFHIKIKYDSSTYILEQPIPRTLDIVKIRCNMNPLLGRTDRAEILGNVLKE